MKALHIDSSISGAQSVSRQLTAGVVARLKQTIPSLEVTYRDLVAAPLPQQSPAIMFAKMKAMHEAGALSGDMAEMVAAAVRNGAHVDAATQADLAATGTALDEFLAADIVVVGAPMYNFGIPSQLKAWIDCLAVAGKTFRYSAAGVEGLAAGKRVIVASSRGGFYGASSPAAALDHQESYLSGFFAFIGITNVEFVRAEGVNVGPEQRERALAGALAEAGALRAA
jgi:FMN-dependent NADH-azoreductase